MPSSFAHAAASQRSVAVIGSSGRCSATSSSPASLETASSPPPSPPEEERGKASASAKSALRSIFPFSVSGSVFRQWIADGTMYLGSSLASWSRSTPGFGGGSPEQKATRCLFWYVFSESEAPAAKGLLSPSLSSEGGEGEGAAAASARAAVDRCFFW